MDATTAPDDFDILSLPGLSKLRSNAPTPAQQPSQPPVTATAPKSTVAPKEPVEDFDTLSLPGLSKLRSAQPAAPATQPAPAAAPQAEMSDTERAMSGAWMGGNPAPKEQPAPKGPMLRFDELTKDHELLNAIDIVAKKTYDIPEQAISDFIEGRVATDQNSISASTELYDASTAAGRGDTEYLRALGVLRDRWKRLPDFWEEGGRPAMKAIPQNAMWGLVDVPTVVGLGVGKVVGKAAGVGVNVAVDALTSAAIDQANQRIDVSTGAQKEVDWQQTARAAAVSGITSLGTGALANSALPKYPTPNPPSTSAGLAMAGKIGPGDPPPMRPISEVLSDAADVAIKETLDQYHMVKVLQEKATGVGGEVGDLLKATKEARRTAGVDPAGLPYFQFRMLASASDRAESFIRSGGQGQAAPDVRSRFGPWGQEGMEFNPAGVKSLNDIMNPLAEIGEAGQFMQWMAAKREQHYARSKGVNRSFGSNSGNTLFQDYNHFYNSFIEQGFSPQESINKAFRVADDIAQKGDMKPHFKQAAAEMQSLSQSLLEYQRARGMLSEDDVTRILRENPYYVPMYHYMEKGGQSVSGAPTSPGRARHTGSEDNVAPFYNSYVDHVFKAIYSSDRNAAKLSFYDTMKDGVSTGRLAPDTVYRKLSGKDFLQAEKAFKSSVIRELNKQGYNVAPNAQIAHDLMLRVMTYNTDLLSGAFRDRNIDVVLRNGKQEFYEILDKGMADLFATRNVTTNEYLQWAKKIDSAIVRGTQMYGAAITSNPVFFLKNTPRDTISASVNSAFGFKPGVDTFRGLMKSFNAGAEYREAMANGMSLSGRDNFLSASRNAAHMDDYGIDAASKRYYDHSLSMIKKFGATPYQAWTEAITRGEMATRMGEYLLARKAGLSKQGASFAGREVATDFGMSGSNPFVRWYNQHTNFFNAGIQGLYKTVRTGIDHPLKTLALGSSYVMLPDIASWAINTEFPEYAAVPQVIKDTNVLLPNFKDWEAAKKWYLDPDNNPKPELEGFILWPKSYDVGAMGTIAVGILDGIRNSNVGESFMQAAIRGLVQSVPGIDVPLLVRPVKELAVTGKTWTGQSINPPWADKLEGEKAQGYDYRTNMLAIELARSVRNATEGLRGEGKAGWQPLTPFEIEYLINFATPGMMQIATMATEAWAEQSLRPPTMGALPAKRSDEFDPANPVSFIWKSFHMAMPNKTSAVEQKFYEISKEVNALKSTAANSEKDLFKILLNQFHGEDYKDRLDMEQMKKHSAYLADVAEQLKRMRQDTAMVHVDPKYTPEQKREEIDELIRQRNNLAYNTLENLKRHRDGATLFNTLFKTHDPEEADKPKMNPAAAVIKQTKELFGGESK